MKLFKQEKYEGFTLTYQKNEPDFFIRSVEQYITYSDNNPDYRLGEEEKITIVDKNGTILTHGEYEYDDVLGYKLKKKLAIQIALDPLCQASFIKLTERVIQQMSFNYKEENYQDDDHSHAQELMHGLIAIDPTAHVELIKNWILKIDWYKSGDELEVLYDILEQGGITKNIVHLFVMKFVFYITDKTDKEMTELLNKVDDDFWVIFIEEIPVIEEYFLNINYFDNTNDSPEETSRLIGMSIELFLSEYGSYNRLSGVCEKIKTLATYPLIKDSL